MRKIILLLILNSFSLAFLSCGKELLLPVMDDKVSIQDFELSYKLMLKKTNEIVGKASIKVQSFKRQGKVFYTINQYTEIEQTDYTNYLILQSVSTADANFKLRVFQGKIVENKESSVRKGYYNYPYYYIEKDEEKSRFKASRPLYSSIVEHYIMRNILIERNDAVSYFLFNIVSLQAEEESISFEKEEDMLKEYKIRNHKNDYTSFYKVDKDYRIVEKTDFANLIIWKLEN